MSYCRFGQGGVYVFHSVGGYATCMLCNLMPDRVVENGVCRGASFHSDYNTSSRKEMISHLKEHIEKGDMVPDITIERIEMEITEGGDTFE